MSSQPQQQQQQQHFRRTNSNSSGSLYLGSPESELPAFMSNEKYMRMRASNTRRAHKTLGDCCYSTANILLIVASIVALVFVVKFLTDDSLYDFGEQLLGLAFYRQLIFMCVVLPLVLLVPLFNACAGIMMTSSLKHELSNSLLSMKVLYEVVLIVLVFIGLVFVAPSIRTERVSAQLEYELRRHMFLRYDSDFSYLLLDAVQQEFECCDETFYKRNMRDHMPMTCFQQDGQYDHIFARNCADVIGSLVSTRCAILAACFVTILVALGILLCVETLDWLTRSSRNYDVGSHEQQQQHNQQEQVQNQPQQRHSRLRASSEALDATSASIAAAPREPSDQDELLEGRRKNQPSIVHSDDDDDDDGESPRGSSTPILLTRAQYVQAPRVRTQSPVLASTSLTRQPKPALKRTSPASPTPPQTTDFIDSSSGDDQDDDDVNTNSQRWTTSPSREEDEHAAKLREYQRQITSELQTRKSMLNVRFADEPT